jgi:hypothetical protein
MPAFFQAMPALLLGAPAGVANHTRARYQDGPWINLQTILAPTLGVYHTTQEILDEVDNSGRKCKATFKVETASNSTDGKWPIRVVSLGDPAEHKGRILLLFGIHGREYLSAEIGVAFMRGLCDDTSAAKHVLSGTSFTIIPVLNPSGRDYVRTGGHSCADMRKNGHGVDLNRNFDVSWTDGSDVSNAEDYRGASPFSEAESQLVKKLVDEGKPHMFIDVHTGDLSMLMPWNDREKAPPEDEKAAMFKILEHALAEVPWGDEKPQIGVGALTGTPAYLASGTTGDYAYSAGVKYPFIWETYRLDEFRRGARRGARHMDAVQWSQGHRPRWRGNKPQMLAPVGTAPSNAPSDFVRDDCFKFFNPVSSEMLLQYTAQWKTALMRASQYLADEHNSQRK